MTTYFHKLLSLESGIYIEKHDWYRSNIDNPVIEYPVVSSPGHVIRDDSGKPITKKMTVREYFITLGVNKFFNADIKDSLVPMQYASINAFGFIGYQFGEELLHEHGYYIYNQAKRKNGKMVNSYYKYFNDDGVWANKRKSILISPNREEEYIGTDVNQWKGHFTGKNSIHSLQDLTNPHKQEILAKDIFNTNFDKFINMLNVHGINNGVEQNEIYILIDKTKNYYNKYSIIAAIHLCGILNTFQYITKRKISIDEFGTSIDKYINMFHNYPGTTFNRI